MRRLTLIALAAVSLAMPAQADHYIAADRGGTIKEYFARYSELSARGERVIINGDCASSCTFVLFPEFNLNACVTQNARFGFHRPIADDRPTPEANLQAADDVWYAMLGAYNEPTRNLLMTTAVPDPMRGDHGGEMLWVKGKNLLPVCESF